MIVRRKLKTMTFNEWLEISRQSAITKRGAANTSKWVVGAEYLAEKGLPTPLGKGEQHSATMKETFYHHFSPKISTLTEQNPRLLSAIRARPRNDTSLTASLPRCITVNSERSSFT